MILKYNDSSTDPVFLIGNGLSRNNFDLNALKSKGLVVGCNALYRDFSPDILTAVDVRMLKEIKSNYKGTVLYPIERSVCIPDSIQYKSQHYNTSGCFAMQYIARQLKPKVCYMLGMDAYPGNIYSGTENYKAKEVQAFTVFTNYYRRLLESDMNTLFVNVNVKDTWEILNKENSKYKHINYEEFEKCLAKLK